jgi:hypothetical protein
VFRKLGVHRSFRQRLRELLEKPVLPGDVFRAMPMLDQQLIDQLWISADAIYRGPISGRAPASTVARPCRGCVLRVMTNVDLMEGTDPSFCRAVHRPAQPHVMTN